MTAQGAELRFERVGKRYGPVTAVELVDLVVGAGEFFALLGPSGSGKTTLLGMVAGFITPSEGRITVGGRDITRLPPEQRNIGMVFQNYSLFPFLNVARNIAFPLQMRRWPKPRIAACVEKMLAMVRLSEMAEPHAGAAFRRPAAARRPRPRRLLRARGIADG